MIRLKAIGVLSAAKISALLYGAISLLLVPIFLIMAVASIGSNPAPNQLPGSILLAFAILAPPLYAAMGFVTGAAMAFVYNLIAGWIGGLELQFENFTPVRPEFPNRLA